MQDIVTNKPETLPDSVLDTIMDSVFLEWKEPRCNTNCHFVDMTIRKAMEHAKELGYKTPKWYQFFHSKIRVHAYMLDKIKL